MHANKTVETLHLVETALSFIFFFSEILKNQFKVPFQCQLFKHFTCLAAWFLIPIPSQRNLKIQDEFRLVLYIDI